MRFSEAVLHQGRAVTFLAFGAAIAGLVVARGLPKGVYPEIAFPREQVVANLAGASAETVEVGVTRPLEATLAAIPGVVTVRSRTIRGATEVSLFFDQATHMVEAHSLVLAAVAEVRSELPHDTEVTAERVLPSGFPILSFNVEGPYPPQKLYELTQYTIRPALTGLPGVGRVEVQSSDVPETQVRLDPVRLAAAQLTPADVAQRLREANVLQAVARLDDAHELRLGVVDAAFGKEADIGEVIVGGDAAHPVRVRDVATVVAGVAPRTSVIRVDGGPGVILNIARRLGGDTLQLDQAVRARLDELRPSLPPGLKLVPVYEQARFVSDAVNGVRDAVLFGAFFAVVVLALFLRDFRATLIAAASLPLTLGASLLSLYALNQTLNVMTLGGLAVAVGLVIDDAVVIVEGIHHFLEQGLSPREATTRAVDTLFWPVFGTTATTMVVFLPLGLLSGVAGQFFTALSISLVSAVAISMIVALVVLPPAAELFLRPVPKRRTPFFTRWYERGLAAAFRWRTVVLIVVGVVTVLGVLLFRVLPSGFLPEADEGAYVVDYFAPVGASLEDADALAKKLEAVISQTPEVAAFSRRMGAELGPPTATLSSRGDVAVRLKDQRSRAADEIMNDQRRQIEAAAPGLRVEFIQVLADMLGDLEGSPEPIEVKYFGPDPKVLADLAKQGAERLKDVPGLVDVFDGDEGCAPELRIVPDRLALHRAGLNATQLAEQLSGAFVGEVATTVRRPDHLEPIRVVGRTSEMNPVAVGEYPVVASGGLTQTAALTHADPECFPASLLRENQRNMLHFTARLEGVSLGEAAKAVSARLAGWTLPPGYSWELGGLVTRQAETFRSLFAVLAVALSAVLAVLLFQLRRLRWALAVLAAVPMAATAALFTLFVTGEVLNVSSLMGIILLTGLVVKNGILLLDHALIEESHGMAPLDALRAAARERIRPILMTSLATLAGLLPLVVGIGAGAALHRPLAIAVVGGLGLSTLATLFVIPLLASLRRSRRAGGAE